MAASRTDAPEALRAEALSKAYGARRALQDVSFSAAPGELLAIIGPNGAGKTTLLQILAGALDPTTGRVSLDRRDVGWVPQQPAIYSKLSVRENLRLFARLEKVADVGGTVERMLEQAGLSDRAGDAVGTLSGGNQQRVNIAVGLLGDPAVLLLDEPANGLDPEGIHWLRGLIRRQADEGRTVLVSSHLLAEVEQTCTHVVVMHKGTVVANGPVDDVVGDSPIAHFEVSDVPAATEVLDGLDGVRSVSPDGTGLVVDIDGTPRTDVVAALVRAGVGVDRVVPRRRLEDAFLTLVGGDSKASGER
jgi:ABC-2 type transport system ATP-binding protein